MAFSPGDRPGQLCLMGVSHRCVAQCVEWRDWSRYGRKCEQHSVPESPGQPRAGSTSKPAASSKSLDAQIRAASVHRSRDRGIVDHGILPPISRRPASSWCLPTPRHNALRPKPVDHAAPRGVAARPSWSADRDASTAPQPRPRQPRPCPPAPVFDALRHAGSLPHRDMHEPRRGARDAPDAVERGRAS
jgi:hypothetical protein